MFKKNNDRNYSMVELRRKGCPDSLLMQYVLLTKEEVDKIVNSDKNKLLIAFQKTVHKYFLEKNLNEPKIFIPYSGCDILEI